MAATTKSKVTPKYKTKYRVRNWLAYEASLRKRGDVTLWFDEEAVQAWSAPRGGVPGGQRKYSNLAIERFTADGACDTRPIYSAVARAGTPDVTVVVPPSRRAALDPGAVSPWDQRNDAIERIVEVGRRQWRKESGAHRQARAENAMFRYKRIIGDGLRARSFEAQKREAMVAVRVLNRMTLLGRPISVAIRT